MSEGYLGEIRIFGGSYAPKGWAFCDGRELAISGHEALFSLIGTTYGGNGTTTFALPDFRGRLPLHMGTNPMTQTNYSIGQKGGTEQVTLSEINMPEHTHQAYAYLGDANVANPTNAVWAKSGIEQFSVSPYVAVPEKSMSTTALNKTGNNEPHENMMPFLATSFIICMQGEYPVQN